MKTNPSLLSAHLDGLKLPFIQKHHAPLAQQCAEQQWDHVEYLRRLVEGHSVLFADAIEGNSYRMKDQVNP